MASWFIVENGRERGPFKLLQLQKFVNGGELSPSSILRRHDGALPITAADIEGLFPAPPGADLRWKDDPQPAEKQRPIKFDPYHAWFGIKKDQQPPTHYRLLGLDPFEDDTRVIEEAARQRLSSLSQKKTGPNADSAQRLFNDVVSARKCLIDAAAKAAYDRELRNEPAASPTTPAPAINPLPELAVSNSLSPALPKKKPNSPLWQLAQIVAGGLAGVMLAVLFLWYGLGKDITGFFRPKAQTAARPVPTSDDTQTPPPPARSDDSAVKQPPPTNEPVTIPNPSVPKIANKAPPPPPAIEPSLPKPVALKLPHLCRVSFNGHAYAFIPLRTTWNKAREACERVGGHLVVIETAAENKFLLNLSNDCLPEYWTGATDEKSEGDWCWVDGSKVDADAINLMADNANGKEHWLAYWRGFRNWNDQIDGELPFLCEWDSTEPTDYPVEPDPDDPLLQRQTLTIRPVDATNWRHLPLDEAWSGSTTTAPIHKLTIPGKFENFELRCQVRLDSASGNGGITFRGDGVIAGREMEIGGDGWGNLFDVNRRRFLVARNTPHWFVRPVWNDIRIRAEGEEIRFWINGIRALDYRADSPAVSSSRSGPISFLAGINNAPISYRNIQFRSLDPPAMAPQVTSTPVPESDDRALWMHEAGFYFCRESGKWTEMILADGRVIHYLEVDRNPLFIELRDESGRNTIRLSTGSATNRRDGQRDFAHGYFGTWQPSLDSVPVKFPSLAKGEEIYTNAVKRAREEFVEKVNIRITRLRKSTLKADRQSLENMEVDLKSFERAGLVPWSAAMRPASLDYLKEVRNAREAFLKLIATEVGKQASSSGPLEKTLRAYRFVVVEPMIVMELDCRSSDARAHNFHYALFIDGYVNDRNSPIRWRADQTVIELTGIPKDITDRYVVDPNGRTVEMTNNFGGKATGKLTTAPDAMMPFQLNGVWVATYPDTFPDGRKFTREIKGIRVHDWDGKQDLRLIGSAKELLIQWPSGPWERFVIDPASPDRMVGIIREGRKCIWERQTETR